MAIKFTLTPEQRAANGRKASETVHRKMAVRYTDMLNQYYSQGLDQLTNAQAGKRLGVSADTVRRMLLWSHRESAKKAS